MARKSDLVAASLIDPRPNVPAREVFKRLRRYRAARLTADARPIRAQVDYESALAEIERLWGAKAGTPDGDRLDVLATLIDAYEAKHYPMDPPDPSEPKARRLKRRLRPLSRWK